MSIKDELNLNIPKQEEVRLDPVIEKASETQRKVFNPKSNAVKRKRASHRKPPRTNFDSTSPLGVLTEFEIPNMLLKYHLKVCQILEIEDPNSIEPLTINDVMNPVRDIINDSGVLDAFNWRELKNVEVLSMSAKGDGLAIIKAPSYETILKCQELANDREKKQFAELEALEAEKKVDGCGKDEKESSDDIKIEGTNKRQRKKQSEEPYRRQVNKETLPKVQIATVPFAFPGDFVNLKVYHTNSHYVDSEIIGFTKLSPLRNEVLNNETVNVNDEGIIKPKENPCAYFGICSGCQYQSLSYENQLLIKKEVVENAYKHFCKDEVDWEGKVLNTIPSPLKYGYRTKLTPHYDIPRSGTKGLNVPRLGFGWRGKGAWLKLNNMEGEKEFNEGIEFDNKELKLQHPEDMKIGMRNRSIRPYFGDVLDIEDCIIGTDIVRLGFVNERKRLNKEWKEDIRSKKGVTVLLRENNIIKSDKDFNEESIIGSRDITSNDEITQIEAKVDNRDVIKTCVTDNQKIVSDLVDTGFGKVLRFDFIANEFFQNNNSILPKVIKYVKDNLDGNEENEQMEYLVDAYCGSGLFSVAIASNEESKIKKVLGVEISERAVEFAKKNAELNNISQEHCDFIHGKAEKLFEHINFPKETTGVILDPPRKGCDDIFLKQLSEFEPNRIVYVSCNVHSQARDVKYFLNETVNGNKYKIESIRGFDFFPQTHHVESVAVLVHK